MSLIKNVVIAFLISFFILVFITSNKIRLETFKILNHKIGKSKIRIYNVFAVLISFIIILYSYKLLNKSKIIASLIERKNSVQQEEKTEKNEANEIYE